VSEAVFEQVREHLAGAVQEATVAHGTLALLLEPARLLEAVRALKDSFGFDMFLDVTAVDWPEREPRFDVAWHFYSTREHVRVRIKARVTEKDAIVDSLKSLYGSAGYMERECHDMYGIRFDAHPDLRRIYLYDEFEGHPLRKDYPKQKEQPLVPDRAIEAGK